MRQSELTKGDVVWAVFRGIAIRCNVMKVEDLWAKKHLDGIYFYWLDEPVGHSLPVDELILDVEEAKEALLSLWDDDSPFLKEIFPTREEYLEERNKHINLSLNEWREAGAGSIIKTHEHGGHKHPGWEDGFMPPKKQGEDWFNITMLLEETNKQETNKQG